MAEPFLICGTHASRAAVADLLASVTESVGAVASLERQTAEGCGAAVSNFWCCRYAQRGEAQARLIGVLAPFSVPFGSATAHLRG